MDIDTRRRQCIQDVESATQLASAAFESLEVAYSRLPDEALQAHLLHCGIIPEQFTHDSTQEKLWAKLCDILLAGVFNRLGIASTVIRTRGNSADVHGGTETYSIVADAKAFRLSRTAKNQKDFKVTALDDWRRSSTFACLVAPLYQFPQQASQIYAQAIAKNVTLLGYAHLAFLIDHGGRGLSLESLWRLPNQLSPSQGAAGYWSALEQHLLTLAAQPAEALKIYKQADLGTAKSIGQDGIEYWRATIQAYQHLSGQEAIDRLIRAEKIEQRILTLQRTVEQLNAEF